MVGSAWWIGEGTAVAEALGEVRLLLLIACLHGLLEACRLGLLEGSEAGLHGLLLGWRHGVVAGGLRHHAILLETVAAVLLGEAGHLWLHALHSLPLARVLGHHVGVVASELGLQRWWGTKGTLLRVLWR